MTLETSRLGCDDTIDIATASLSALQALDPYLMDATLRENAVGSTYGQTLAQKIHLYHALKSFGLSKIIVGALNYAHPEELQVDDDFMCYLRDSGYDMQGCFCFTNVGRVVDGVFEPTPSQLKMRAYRVPNTLHEVYLSKEHTSDNAETITENIRASVNWLRTNIEHAENPGDIILNIVDGCDAFSNNLSVVSAVLALAADLDLAGVSIEDDRGTYFPFQVASFVKHARNRLPASMKLLVHFHASSGMENACVIEALLNGADGAWGGMAKSGGVSGHASLSELIGNFVRIGNVHMDKYQLDQLIPLVRSIEAIGHSQATTAPVYGADVYKLNLSYFEQKRGRFMDLPPGALGIDYGYQICPVMSDTGIIKGRLSEVAGVINPPEDVLTMMLYMMRRSLRAGLAINYDDPVNVVALYKNAVVETNNK